MRRTATIAVTGLVAVSVLAGCGSDDDKKGSASGGDSYCATLKKASTLVTDFTAEGTEPDFGKFQDFLDKADELSDKAPDTIEDDWDTMLGAMDDLVDALEDAGLSIEQFGEMATTGQMPDGVDQAKLLALGSKLESLSSEKIEAAGDAISKHAKDECDVDLDKAAQ